MCGRYTLRSATPALARMLGVEEPAEHAPRYNIAPSQPVLVCRETRPGDRALAPMRWGLVPAWAKDNRAGYRMINARAETLEQKPAFRTPFKRRRCLIPADGFYEWQKVSNGKQPWFIQANDGGPFAFAGLWERWEREGQAPLESCAIITTEANDR